MVAAGANISWLFLEFHPARHCRDIAVGILEDLFWLLVLFSVGSMDELPDHSAADWFSGRMFLLVLTPPARRH